MEGSARVRATGLLLGGTQREKLEPQEEHEEPKGHDAQRHARLQRRRPVDEVRIGIGKRAIGVGDAHGIHCRCHVGQVSDLESAHQQLNALAEDAGDGQQRSRHQKTVATQGRSQADDGARRHSR